MNKLIIAEKPSVALRLALSLGDGRPTRKILNGVSYYEVLNGTDILYIVAAVGHLFTIRQKDQSKELPIFNVEWVASYKVNPSSYFTKKYLDAIVEAAKKCHFFINACDYDLEGTVIGTNAIKYIINNSEVNANITGDNVKRMRFSTTTNQDLLDAYKNMSEFDSSYFQAGEARHMLDWMWGINMSRALIRAMSSTGVKKILSVGRVQGPTLGILAKREYEIRDFKPQDYWKVFITCSETEFENRKGNIFEEEIAKQILEKTKAAQVMVQTVDTKDNESRPYPPFDLTSMQLEASRVFGIDPSQTLKIAQSLYERSYISYPRTTSQKLPYTLNLPRVIKMLSASDKYKVDAEKLIAGNRYRPAEGMKEHEAHPAIYPTGEPAKKLTVEEEKIYDLIVRRFLACFAEYATIESKKIVLNADGEEYEATASKVKKPGWISFYPYYKPRDSTLPDLQAGSQIKPDKVHSKKLVTEPPKRYTKATLIALLEKKDLGTKATRSEIIDTLFKREYIKNGRIEATGLGLSVYTALKNYCPEILDEDLTRQLEKDMDKITKGTEKQVTVINEGEEIIKKIIGEFKQNEKGIGEELQKGLKESMDANIIGTCVKDGGNLVIKRSKAGKQFVGCSNWPNCNNAYPLPQMAKIVPSGKICEICKTPKVKVFRRGKRPFEMDLDPSCPSKKDWAKPAAEEAPKVQKASEIAAVPATAAPAKPEGEAAQPKAKKKKAAKSTKAKTVKAKKVKTSE
jgi:DNA topoisomerase I